MILGKYKKYCLLFTALAIVLIGCGGGSDGGIEGSGQNPDELTGKFVDSPVEGIRYRTATRSGVTNANGEFKYLNGETIVFGLGDLEFPSVTADQILTPLDLAGVSDINNTQVVNMARLLQSLDKDCDADNGISISGAALLAAAGLVLSFDDPEFETKVANLVANGGQENNTCKTLISASQAVSHLQATLDSLDLESDSPASNNLLSKVGIWEGQGQQQGTSWTIRIDIKASEQLIEYPSLNCGGHLTLVDESELHLLFKETITYGNGSCVNQGFVELIALTSDELAYRYYWPGAGEEKGELEATGSVNKTNADPEPGSGANVDKDTDTGAGSFADVTITTDPDLSQGIGLFEDIQANFSSYENSSLKIKAPDIAENGAVVPFTLEVPASPGTLWMFADTYSDKVAMKADFLTYNDKGTLLSSRIKLNETSMLYGVFVDANGKKIAARKEVKVTIGGELVQCNTSTCSELDGNMRLRATTGILKMLVTHPIYSDQYIKQLSVTLGAQPVAEIYTTPYISKNPYFSFYYPVSDAKVLGITLTDNLGNQVSDEVNVIN